MDNADPLLLQRAATNPYRVAAGLIWNRLKWDLNILSWISGYQLRKCRNSHTGEKAIILCNGPSILRTDLDSITGAFVFGLNKISLLFDQIRLRPDAIVAVNRLVIEQHHEFFRTVDTPLFLDSYARRYVPVRDNITYLHSTSLQRFSRDCSWSIYQGYTVTFVAIQLAFHMGFQEVALVGCDHDFDSKGPPNATVVAEGADRNHFHPDYFGHGQKWQLPDLFQSEVAYTLARQSYAAHDRRIVNCTLGGKLEVFPRMNLIDFLRKREN